MNAGKLIFASLLFALVISSSGCVRQNTSIYPTGSVMNEPNGMKVINTGDEIIIWIASDRLFQTDSSEFTPAAPHILRDMCKILNKHPNKNIHISANSDSIKGHPRSPAFDLSTKQASRIAVTLWGLGIDKKSRRLTFSGDKNKYPIATRKNLLGKTENRRIEIILYDKENYSITGYPEKHFPDEEHIF